MDAKKRYSLEKFNGYAKKRYSLEKYNGRKETLWPHIF